MTNIGEKWRRGRPGIDWTPAMVRDLKKLYKEKTQKQLAAHFNCTLSALKASINRYSVEKKRIRGWTKKDDGYLLKNYPEYTKQEIADHLGRSRSAVIRRYKNLK